MGLTVRDFAGCGVIARCVVVNLHGVRVLVDCAATTAEATACACELPQRLERVLAHIDAVLVSDVRGCDLLPVLYRALARRLRPPRLYATAPVLFVARRVLAARAHEASEAETEAEKSEAEGTTTLLGYTAADVARAIDAAVEVNYGEEVRLLDGAALACAQPSGCELGGCCWRLSARGTSVVVLAHVSRGAAGEAPKEEEPVPSCRPWRADTLAGATHIVVAAAPAPDAAPAYAPALREIADATARTLAAGGSVLVPCEPGSTVLDLLDTLVSVTTPGFSGGNSSSGSGSDDPTKTNGIPILVVAEGAHDVLEYATVCSEWLRAGPAARVLALGDAYAHTARRASGALRTYARATGNWDDARAFAAAYREPCVVLAAPPSCARGAAALLAARLAPRARNTLVLADSRAACPPGARCRVVVAPLDTALHATAPALAHTLRAAPGAVVLARAAIIERLFPKGHQQCVVIPGCGARAHAPIDAQREGVPASITHSVAAQIAPVRRARTGFEHSLFVGALPRRAVATLQTDGSYCIDVPTTTSGTVKEEQEHEREQPEEEADEPQEFGDVSIERLLEGLARRGMRTVRVLGGVGPTVALRVEAPELGTDGAVATVLVDTVAHCTDIVTDCAALEALVRETLAADCLHALTDPTPL